MPAYALSALTVTPIIKLQGASTRNGFRTQVGGRSGTHNCGRGVDSVKTLLTFIGNAHVFIALLSDTSITRPWVLQEMGYAAAPQTCPIRSQSALVHCPMG